MSQPKIGAYRTERFSSWLLSTDEIRQHTIRPTDFSKNFSKQKAGAKNFLPRACVRVRVADGNAPRRHLQAAPHQRKAPISSWAVLSNEIVTPVRPFVASFVVIEAPIAILLCKTVIAV